MRRRVAALLVFAAACSDGAGPADEATGAALVEAVLPRYRAADDEALRAAEAALVADPDFRAAQALFAEGRLAEAEARLDALVERWPDWGRVRFLRAVARHEQTLYAAARPELERVLREGPDFHRAHNALYYYGWCLLKLGELEGARAAFEAHLELEPDEGDSHFALGLIDWEEDRVDAAGERFQRALELFRRPEDLAKGHARLADVLERRGRLREARAEVEASIRAWPTHPEAWFQLSRVLRALGDEDGADRALARHEELVAAGGG